MDGTVESDGGQNMPHLDEGAHEAGKRHALLAAQAEAVLYVSQSLHDEGQLLSGHLLLQDHAVETLEDCLEGHSHFLQGVADLLPCLK